MALGLRAKFLLISLIPTLLIVAVLIILYVGQLNRFMIQNQKDQILMVAPTLERLISSPEILNYQGLLQNAIQFLTSLRKELSRISILTYENGNFLAIAASDMLALDREHMPHAARSFRLGQSVTYSGFENGRNTFYAISPLRFEGKPVAVVFVASPFDFYAHSMGYLK
jgi:hypothetical protein